MAKEGRYDAARTNQVLVLVGTRRARREGDEKRNENKNEMGIGIGTNTGLTTVRCDARRLVRWSKTGWIQLSSYYIECSYLYSHNWQILNFKKEKILQKTSYLSLKPATLRS